MQAKFFVDNRRRLFEQSGSPIILAGYTAMQRMADASFGFEQEASFWYLTGINEPDWGLVISGDQHTLIAPDISYTHQIFDGSLNWELAKSTSGVDDVVSHKDGMKLIKNLSTGYKKVHTIIPNNNHYEFTPNPAPTNNYRVVKRLFEEVVDCRPLINQLRAIKQPVEIEAMKKAIDITIMGFEELKSKLPSLKNEYEVEAELTYKFRRYGATGHAYDPIVAMAGNACTLHYVKNDSSLSDGLLLIDAGARFGGYAADITRTYNLGKVSDRQKSVHEAVVRAQREVVQILRPGLKIIKYQELVDDIMRRALDSLGLLKVESDYRKYFPHAISHGLGIDVHDTLGGATELMPGMVITVEPGIYIPNESIGVRIEDDILITKTGNENLSVKLSTNL